MGNGAANGANLIDRAARMTAADNAIARLYRFVEISSETNRRYVWIISAFESMVPNTAADFKPICSVPLEPQYIHIATRDARGWRHPPCPFVCAVRGPKYRARRNRPGDVRLNRHDLVCYQPVRQQRVRE